MSKMSPFQGVPLPKDWPEYVRLAVIHSIALAHRAITYSRSFAINSSIERVRLAGQLDRALNENALLREEIRIKDARMADGLCRIIDVEGPMLAKRSYDIYLRGCGIRRMGRELKRTMNKALQYAIQNGRVVKEDESDRGGLVYTIVRLKGTPPVLVRERGPRRFEEIPPSELQYVARRLADKGNHEAGSDTHLRAVLEFYDLKRLTVQVGTMLLESLDHRYPYVEEVIRGTSDPKPKPPRAD